MPVKHQIVKNLSREENLKQVIIVVPNANNSIVLAVQMHGIMVHANLITMMNSFYVLLRKNSSKHVQGVVNWYKKYQDAIILLVFVNFNFVIFAKKIIEINVNASIYHLGSIVF